jgi:hypothetical protein
LLVSLCVCVRASMCFNLLCVCVFIFVCVRVCVCVHVCVPLLLSFVCLLFCVCPSGYVCIFVCADASGCYDNDVFTYKYDRYFSRTLSWSVQFLCF